MLRGRGLATVESKLHASVERFMVWIIAICGAHSAVGRKLVSGLENEVLYDVSTLVFCAIWFIANTK